MTATPTDLHHFGPDVDLGRFAAEFARQMDEAGFKYERSDHGCPDCGQTIPDWICRSESVPGRLVLDTVVRSALIAGWDALSGCWGGRALIVLTAARLKDEGFGGPAR